MLIYNVILTSIDVTLLLISVTVYVFICCQLIKRDPDFPIKFYGILIINNTFEFVFIFVEYFIVRLPFLNFLNDWYSSLKVFPGIIYGLSVYLPCVIGFGHLTQVINRFIIIKFPFSFEKIFNKWLVGFLFLLQFFFPFIILVWCWSETGSVTVLEDKSATYLELKDFNKQYKSIIFGICSIMISCTACCFFGIWSFILVVKMRNGKNASQLRREINLFVFVSFEILSQILLIIVAIFQVISGSISYNEQIYFVTLHVYPFSEDLLCLINGLILLITCKTVRSKYFQFYGNILACQKCVFIKSTFTRKLSSNRINAALSNNNNF
ncbi:7TM GPCR, serpentine receptor class v (Srv) family-containing protein [Strongyloides ratti]|uniref:7TM GPCR, serpentine receptor class v (Srv) family-containing protein n=1 Tax=Strongyloides ratti TaxID=34506 RepID=A0A090MZL0_STRRB|nr:7TM GPCR, serpentine receptor class v (Srv) family-containing protein [Strongyloides ratti]CEF69119.1 7TM GPCR, serpentine receptor class v (Srv) family-containing protein [Strongyloides ratti]